MLNKLLGMVLESRTKYITKLTILFLGVPSVEMWVGFQFWSSVCWVMCERSFLLDSRKILRLQQKTSVGTTKKTRKLTTFQDKN